MAISDLFTTAAPTTPTNVARTEVGMPTAFAPQISGLLGSAAQQTFNIDPTSGQITGAKAYQPYSMNPADYVAGFSPMQEQAYRGAANLGLPEQYGQAAGLASLAGISALGAGQYMPSYFGNAYQAPGAYQAQNISAQNVTAPSLQQYSMTAPEVSAPTWAATAQAAQLGAAPTVGETQFAGPGSIGYQGVGTQSFVSPGAAASYMSPYMQNVVDVQQQQAQRQANIANQALKSSMAKAGAFGGGRYAVEQSLAAAELARQKQAIQAQGLQSAFGEGQKQFNTEQQQALQAQLANQQAGLTAGQFNVQQAYNTALQNAQLRQAANLANQQMLGQYGLQQGQFNQAAALANPQYAQQAAMANQQAGLTAGQQNLQSLLNVQQLGAGQNLTAQQLNQAANLQAQQAAEASRQFGYGQGMTSAQLGAQYGLAGQQAGEASRQFGANLGLQGLAQQLAAAQALGGLGERQLSAQQGILGLQSQYGQQQQQQQQNIINQAIQNYQMQQQYPMQQLGLYNQLLRGWAQPSTTQTQYNAPPSILSQLAGAAAAGTGLYNMFKTPTAAPTAATGTQTTGTAGTNLFGFKNGGLAALGLRNALKGKA